uniref:RING-type E3 ubiquitin transferase n=1 Tax=Macrostomum lignano TaxID=282301 RepID=A0A1I8IZL2_9PLAT
VRQVLLLIGTVAHHEPELRFEFCENTAWQPIGLFVGFLTCTVPLCLKARLLATLTVFAETPQLSVTVWQALQQSRCLTPPSGFGLSTGGPPSVASLTAEVDEAEARVEEFPLTRSALRLLLQLLLSQQQHWQQLHQPGKSGSGGGFCVVDASALRFVNEVVFLKHAMRSYRRPAERWSIAATCIEVGAPCCVL